MALTPVLEDQLWGLYTAYPKHRCTPASFQYPAKMAWRLCAWIIQHLLDQGWATRGDLICDPMAGISTTLLLAADAGFQAWGIELESHFFAEAQANIALNRRVWERLGKPIPRIVQGDARNLLALVQEAGVVVSSPPYVDARQNTTRPRPPASMNGVLVEKDGRIHRLGACDYGSSDGQIGHMPEGNVNAIISSPPYADGCAHTGGDDAHPELIQGGHTGHVLQSYNYGLPPTTSQLGALPMGNVQAVISSPPWEKDADGSLRKEKFKDPEAFAAAMSAQDRRRGRNGTTAAMRLVQMERDAGKSYGTAEGQIGNQSGETYWSAMATVTACRSRQALPSSPTNGSVPRPASPPPPASREPWTRSSSPSVRRPVCRSSCCRRQSRNLA